MSSSEPPWDLYRSFREVREEGSLSAAARALGLTQPTLARHIAALEAQLGRRLFLRSQRGLAPTEAAEEMLPYVEALAATSAALRRAVTPQAGAIGGTVRITASEIVGVERLPPILAAIRHRHPGLTLELALSNEVAGFAAPRRRHRGAHGGAGAGGAHRPPARRGGDRAFRPRRLPRGARRAGGGRRSSPRLDVIGFDRETPGARARAGRAFPWLRRERFGFRADSDLAQLAAIRAGFGIGPARPALAPATRIWSGCCRGSSPSTCRSGW